LADGTDATSDRAELRRLGSCREFMMCSCPETRVPAARSTATHADRRTGRSSTRASRSRCSRATRARDRDSRAALVQYQPAIKSRPPVPEPPDASAIECAAVVRLCLLRSPFLTLTGHGRHQRLPSGIYRRYGPICGVSPKSPDPLWGPQRSRSHVRYLRLSCRAERR
jgi:hypothetical protein